MATLPKQVGRQWPLVARATLNIGTDGAVNVNGALTPFNATTGTVYDLLPLPPNAIVLGGSVTVETASNDAGTATISVGDSGNPTRYLAATSTKAAAHTVLVPTGYRGVGEDLRLTLANGTGGATAGVVSVVATYIIADRATEVQPS